MARAKASSRPILVVDDDTHILDFVQMTLEDEGYKVILARDGSEALQVLSEVMPGLILLDMRMPNMDGWHFAEVYRSSFSRRSPIVVMTAAHDARERASQIGAEDYIGKPFDLDDLVATVLKHVRDDSD